MRSFVLSVTPYLRSHSCWLIPRQSFSKKHSFLLRAPSTTAIFNLNFQRTPRPNFPCMGSSNRNHHRNLQVAVVVAVDQNFLIFGGRFGHQRRGPTLLLSIRELRFNWERLNRSVAACVGRPSTATAIWLHIAVAVENRCRGWGPLNRLNFNFVSSSSLRNCKSCNV